MNKPQLNFIPDWRSMLFKAPCVRIDVASNESKKLGA